MDLITSPCVSADVSISILYIVFFVGNNVDGCIKDDNYIFKVCDTESLSYYVSVLYKVSTRFSDGTDSGTDSITSLSIVCVYSYSALLLDNLWVVDEINVEHLDNGHYV